MKIQKWILIAILGFLTLSNIACSARAPLENDIFSNEESSPYPNPRNQGATNVNQANSGTGATIRNTVSNGGGTTNSE